MSTTTALPSATHLLEWLAISLTPGLGPTKARKLVEHFGSPEAVFRASLTELESTGIQAVSAQSLATGKSAELAREEIAKAAAADAMVISVDDPCYPPRLKEIYDPPLILRARGNLEVLTKPGIAMVGTRHPTLIKQGTKLVATWEDVWEDLPAEVRLTLTPPASPESPGGKFASLFPDEGLPPHEKRILSLLKADESMHIDEIVEKLENEMSSSEIFAALFVLELNGKVRQMPGKNFVKSF